MSRPTLLAVLLGLLMAAGAITAPRAKPLPPEDPPAEERVAGTFGRSLDAPTVSFSDDKGKLHVFWLVFPCRQAEQDALRDVPLGAPVVAVGRVLRGGQYSYVLVNTLEKP